MNHRPGVRALVVLTGDELLRGFVQDSHTQFLASQLRRAGVELRSIRFSPDGLDDIVENLQAGIGEIAAQLVVVTGGLGPTHDDRTAEAVACVSGRQLELDEQALAMVEARVRALGRMRDEADVAVFADGNRKQATVPAGSVVLEPRGTAPGFVTSAADGTVFVVLPGPPGELRYAWRQATASQPVQALLSDAAQLSERIVRIWGVPESYAARELESAGHEDDDGCRVTLCAREGELELSIRGTDSSRADALVDRLERAFGERLFATDDERPIAELVGAMLTRRGLKLGVAESCTAGMLGTVLTTTAGTSAFFRGGVICYHNDLKQDPLGVDPKVLEEHGAVSHQAALELARGAQRIAGAEAGVAITGIAGPGRGSEEKPVGTVYVGVALSDRVHVEHLRLVGDRETIRRRSTIAALHLLRQTLLGQLGHGD